MIKHTTTSEINFEKVDGEMFRRTLIEYAKELYDISENSKKEVIKLKKKGLSEEVDDNVREIFSQIFWEEQRGADAVKKLRLVDYILQELGFKLTKFGSIEPNLEKTLRKEKSMKK